MASTGGNLLQRTRCYYFYDTATPCNKREPGQRLLGDRRHQPHARDPRHERGLHRDASLRHVRGARRARRQVHVAGPAGERAIAFADFHRLPGDTPQRDTNLQPTRSSRRSSCRRGLCRTTLSEDPRPPLLCVRAGVGRGRARARRRHDQGGAAGARRRRAQAVARPEAEARCAARPPTEATPSRARRPLLRDAKGFAHNAFKIELARRAIVRALTQAAQRHAAIAVRQEDPVSSHAMATYIGTATSRVDGRAKVTGAAKYAGEFNAPGLATAASSPRPSPRAASRASTRARRCASKACSTCSRTRTGRAWPTPTGLQGRRRAGERLAVPAALRRQGSSSAASRSRWCWPRNGRSRALRRRWCASNTKRAARHRSACAAR
jgi:hypothetical protein